MVSFIVEGAPRPVSEPKLHMSMVTDEYGSLVISARLDGCETYWRVATLRRNGELDLHQGLPSSLGLAVTSTGRIRTNVI